MQAPDIMEYILWGLYLFTLMFCIWVICFSVRLLLI